MSRYPIPAFPDLPPHVFTDTPLSRPDEPVWHARVLHDEGHFDLTVDYVALRSQLTFRRYRDGDFQPPVLLQEIVYRSRDEMLDTINRRFYLGNVGLYDIRAMAPEYFDALEQPAKDRAAFVLQTFGPLEAKPVRKAKHGRRYRIHREFLHHHCDHIRSRHIHQMYIWVVDCDTSETIYKDVVPCHEIESEGWNRYQFACQSLGILAMANLL